MLGVAVLGVSAFFHDSAAALVIDGRPVAAAQEERFTRRRHDPSFPGNAVRYCLAEAGLRLDDVSAIAYYEDPAIEVPPRGVDLLRHRALRLWGVPGRTA